VTHSTLAYPPHEASRLRRIRQYAVPAWMIEQATERRLAGDWRGACAAAGVDVAFDLVEVATEHGDAVAAAFEDDLRHFAPDLLRWHLPRLDRGRTTIVPDQMIVLSRPAPGVPCLYVATPVWLAHGPQRLRLAIGQVNGGSTYLETDWTYGAFWREVVHDWTTSRHLWDARRTGRLRERCGGDEGRAPFLHADGTPRTASELPAADPGRADPAAFTEWVTLLHERGDVEAAFTAAGIELDNAPVDIPSWYSVNRVDPVEVLARMPLALTQVEAEIRRLGADRFWIPYRQYAAVVLERTQTVLRVRLIEHEAGDHPADEVLPEVCWRRLPDLDLLRDGLPPERLHPLVREALFPGRVANEPPVPEPAGPTRIRCRDGWHEVSFRDGVLDIPHSAEEQRREDARDDKKRTPLFAAICGFGSVALIEALLAAGARIDLTGDIHGEPVTLHRLITWLGRKDLDFIVDRIEAEYPELTEEE
jgi:hypothetical protein